MAVTRKYPKFTIANGASLSAGVFLGAGRAHVIQTPAAMDGTAFTFQTSSDQGVTWANVYDGGTELQVTAAASRAIALDPAKFSAFQYLKIRTGTAGAPTAQSAERIFTVTTLPVDR